MKWEYKSLDELGTVARGKSKHRPRNDPDLFGGKYPFIQTANVKSSNFYITDYDTTYNEKGLAQSKLWHPGTLCITIAANIADTGILAMDACFPDSIMGFIPYDNVSDVRFIKYCFDILQRDCKKISQGTAQDNLSWEKLSTIKFPAPHIEIQRKVANILSAYDDLIDNNQKQIKLLEEAAQRLYKEWFVDLRFPGHEHTPIVDGMPEGWHHYALKDVFDYVRGKSYTSAELSDNEGTLMVNLKNIRAFGGYNRNNEKRFSGKYKDNQTLHAGDVVMGVTDMTQERRLVGHVALVPEMGEKMTFSMDLIKLIPKLVSNNYLYSTMFFGEYSKKISPLANGTNVLHLKPDAMMMLEMMIPSQETLHAYDCIIEPIIKRIELLQNQCGKACEGRNLLLPKLMNGEIEV